MSGMAPARRLSHDGGVDTASSWSGPACPLQWPADPVTTPRRGTARRTRGSDICCLSNDARRASPLHGYSLEGWVRGPAHVCVISDSPTTSASIPRRSFLRDTPGVKGKAPPSVVGIVSGVCMQESASTTPTSVSGGSSAVEGGPTDECQLGKAPPSVVGIVSGVCMQESASTTPTSVSGGSSAVEGGPTDECQLEWPPPVNLVTGAVIEAEAQTNASLEGRAQLTKSPRP
ncbi:hypothetical protein HPB47_005590 [Ixodes persulcatus]|uniref:Uncharacterized protein n=1 Tax=Ixodes persulcatus TaxID=34615 RepID=A0AC60PCV7_IXOPE|nr:hypothetical protein HPB47_005590 [Ixodes persulcatus]